MAAQYAQLDERVRQLEARRARRQPAPAPDALLASIAAALGSRIFWAAELVELAVHDAELQRLLGNADARQIGGWLRRCRARADVGPYRLHQHDRDADGTRWSVSVSA